MNQLLNSTSIYRVGCYDPDIDLFESQYVVPQGVTYNSYVIVDEKVAILDTVDPRKTQEWLANLDEVLGDRQPDYLVVHHMEPDHAGSVAQVAQRYPQMKLIGNAKTFPMLKQFTGVDYTYRAVVVKEGDVVELGEHSLTFVMAPMVHWPEAMVSYEAKEKVLFSADGFGRFGDGNPETEWVEEARRYYLNIVGKFGPQVQALLKKAAGLDIAVVAPLHGPVLTGDAIGLALEKYTQWSTYQPEEKGVLVAYASIHGNTAKAALELVEMLKAEGVKVEAIDLTREDWAKAVAKAFQYTNLVLAASTYDNFVFTPMATFLYRLKTKAFQNRTVALVENGTWAPLAAKEMRAALDQLKNITVMDQVVTIRSALDDTSRAALGELAKAVKATLD